MKILSNDLKNVINQQIKPNFVNLIFNPRYPIKRIPFPGCEHFVFDTNEYWECAARSMTISIHHQSSTCKMGPHTDPEAVVDHKLRVHGIKNLRVADTSIIPVTLSAHTNAPSIMIGEKLSDILKEDWSI